MGKMLEEGKSWSGRERNLCYLNDGKGRFTDISLLAGFDLPSDGRAQAFTDWDGDGDLDVWQANRSAPRVRFLLNQLDKNARYLAFRLVGQTCNRDAIGARVTVTLSNGKRLLRTLRAGEGYLGQSSKVVRFGLPGAGKFSASVCWPGGTIEDFGNVAPGGTYTLTQGGTPVPFTKSSIKISARSLTETDEPSSSLRLLAHAKLPLPSLPYADTEGGVIDAAEPSGHPTVILLWASWCQPCLAEIRAFAAEAEAIAQAGVRVCLVNVEDAPETSTLAHASFAQGQANLAFLEAFDVVQRALPGRERESVMPSSMLVSPDGELLAFYKGPVDVATVLEDRRLVDVPDEQFRDEAVPFSGSWLNGPLPVDLLAIPNRLLEIHQTGAAFSYLEKHLTKDGFSSSMVASIYHEAGNQFADMKELAKAKQAHIRALQHQPRHLEARVALAMLYDSTREHAQAIGKFRQVLELQPEHLQAMNSLAWLLATVPDPDLRLPIEAERLALLINRAVNGTMPEPLDTLAAAQAARGKFAEAIATAQRALKLARERNQAGVGWRLEERLALYRLGEAYVQRAR